jgi:hypothetical protein
MTTYLPLETQLAHLKAQLGQELSEATKDAILQEQQEFIYDIVKEITVYSMNGFKGVANIVCNDGSLKINTGIDKQIVIGLKDTPVYSVNGVNEGVTLKSSDGSLSVTPDTGSGEIDLKILKNTVSTLNGNSGNVSIVGSNSSIGIDTTVGGSIGLTIPSSTMQKITDLENKTDLIEHLPST